MNENSHPDELYALWLQLACGIGNAVYLKLFTRFSSCKEIYDCTDFSFLGSKYNCERSLKNKELTDAYELQKKVKSMNIGVITYYDERYPENLKLIQAPPAVLYYIGILKPWKELVGVAVVGTRSMTPYGAKVADEFAFYLTVCGATVISGLAKGIDTCAHRGAIRADGYTIAVLGTPIDEIYPKENHAAFQTLYKRGLVISEMYPGCRKTKADFPNRNRLISGLSESTLIVEAGEHSGALITAHHAIYQNKQVYAVPGALGDAHAGTNKLIKEGVRVATHAKDILDELSYRFPTIIHPEYILTNQRIYRYGNSGTKVPAPSVDPLLDLKPASSLVEPKEEKPKPIRIEPPAEEMMSSTEAKLRSVMRDRIMAADELAEQTGMEVSELLSELTFLEVEGKIRSLAGNRFTFRS